ncbi:hypothetical protein AMEX_G12699, partial [Astyanax mexicanus]
DGDDVALHFNPLIGQKVTLSSFRNGKFSINFKTGSSDGDDVALHFNPLIGQKVTLNSFRNGKWESEESASAEPFTRGAPFTMFVIISAEGYEVSLSCHLYFILFYKYIHYLAKKRSQALIFDWTVLSFD